MGLLGHDRGGVGAVGLKPHAAVAEVVFQGVLVLPWAAGHHPAFGKINGFEGGVIVFYAVGVVFGGGTAHFRQFLAGGGVGQGDFAARVEGNVLRQVQEVVTHRHALARIGGHVAVGVVAVGTAGFKALGGGGAFRNATQVFDL